jgi:uncharacterized protein (DUF2062 family)
MKTDPRRTIRYYWLKFIRLQGDPHVLARGVAIGIFIGVTPTIPFHTILAIALALMLRGSKIAALLFTVIVSNPLTFFFQYYFSWRLGTLLTFRDLSWGKICSVLNLIASHASFQETIVALGGLGRDTIWVMLVGGVILALPFSMLGYLLSYLFFSLWQKKRKKSHRTLRHNSEDIH